MHTTPPLTDALFADLLDPSKSAFDICHEHSLTLAELRAITTGDEFTELIAALHDIAQAREEAQRPELHRIARESLALIANQEPTSNTHAETVRRAAGALLRLKSSAIAEGGSGTHSVTEGEVEEAAMTEKPSEPQTSTRAETANTTPATTNQPNSLKSTTPHTTSPPQPTAALSSAPSPTSAPAA
ncbi:MAG: hypothetical protein D6692_08335 [Planctomycetota bacterium]|nr:MAG: hypothetical protein D6692_08335 [Planctomycetota bacterium]